MDGEHSQQGADVPDIQIKEQLAQVLNELRSQREQVSSLKEEIQGNSTSVAKEFKKE